MKKWLLGTVFASALVLGACGGSGDTKNEAETNDTGGDTTEEVSEAEKLYQQSCASCHANDLSGQAGPGLTDVGSNLSEDEIEKIIIEGKGSMPAGLVGDDDAKILASWLAEKK